MSHALSMSKMSLALLCSYGLRPDVVRVDRPSGKEARIGSITHYMVDCLVKGRPVPADGDEETDAAYVLYRQASAWLAPRLDTVLGSEMGMRYDAERDRAVVGPRRGEAGYDDIGPMILPGTLDLVFRGDDGVLEVVDIKTGKKQYETPWQLYAQAVAVSRLYAEKTVRVGYLYPRKTKCDEPAWETLNEDRLDEEAGRIAKTLRHLPMAEPVRGDWCHRCDAKPNCPQWNADAAA